MTTMKHNFFAVFLACLTLSLGSRTPVAKEKYERPASGPNYWQVDAYNKFPSKGPENAVGVLFWSHGVRGTQKQWGNPPARFIRLFAEAGWDVVKVNRYNLIECGWSCVGHRHVDDLKSRAREASAQGYKYVVVAGQSYGGAISIDAASEEGLIDAVIATAPGHGSDACGDGTGGGRISDTLADQLVDSIEQIKASRIVLSMADGDECMGFNNPTNRLRNALNETGKKFIFLDDSMPIRGHLAAGTPQFSWWYANCLLGFVDPDNTPDEGETRCPHPNPVPRFQFYTYYSLPEPDRDKPEFPIGSWEGAYDVGNGWTRNICIAVEREAEGDVWARVSFGAGSERKFSMFTWPLRRFRAGVPKSFVYLRGKYSMTLTHDPEGNDLGLEIVSSSGKTFTATLQRSCRMTY